MLNKNDIVDVWHDKGNEWIEYTLEELDQYFKFVSKPNWKKVTEIHVHDACANKWMEIYFKNGYTEIYNSVYGTYVTQ